LQNLKKVFQSPSKLIPDQRLPQPGGISANSLGRDDGFDLQSALKRDRQEQDDGFYQPKAGKMMRFVERVDHAHTNPRSNFSHDLPSGQRFCPNENEQGSSRELDELSSNRTNHQKFESDQPVEATLSPDLDSPIICQSINTDGKAKMRLDLAILTQTQHPKRSNTDTRWYRYHAPCPSTEKLLASLSDFDLPMKTYKDPFYSDPNDVPNRKREYAGRQYTVLGSSLSFVKEFEHAIKSFGTAGLLSGKSFPHIPTWEFATPPPKLSDLRKTPIRKSEASYLSFCDQIPTLIDFLDHFLHSTFFFLPKKLFPSSSRYFYYHHPPPFFPFFSSFSLTFSIRLSAN
jgi:hypothetical protein